MSFIVKNGLIQSVTPLKRKPVKSWITVWPFAFLYVIQFVLYYDPELVWDRITYLLYRTYIDFGHAAGFPLLVFSHIFVCLFMVWSVKFRASVQFSKTDSIAEATHVLINTHSHKGDGRIETVDRCVRNGVDETSFTFQQRKWKYASDKGCFVKPNFPTKHSFRHYASWKGNVTTAMLEESKDAFGENKMHIHVPEFADLFVDHALAPFFVFQMFCVLLWCLDEYWMTSLFTGFMMVVMECTVIMQRIQQAKQLRQMAEVPEAKIWVFRGTGKVAGSSLPKPELISTRQLLPMDLIVVPSNSPCPADAVIVDGTCVVNEATLTGESTPQLKETIDGNVEGVHLEMKRHSRHMLYAGTEILLSSGAAIVPQVSTRGHALAVVVKTGFETKQGKLLRTILHSQSRVSENSGEAFAFIGLLLVFALAASGYLLKRGLEDPTKSRWKLFLACTQIITSVVPAELPMELSMAVNQSLLALTRLKVFCTEPFRIPFAGKVDVCCFDKTGTLTTDEMLFAGIDACDGQGIRGKLWKIPSMAEAVLAGCHTLVNLEGQGIAGDAMEKAAVSGLKFRIAKEDTVIRDAASQSTGSDGPSSPAAPLASNRNVQILSRFPFIATLRRMSAIVNVDDQKFVVCKGSPESLQQICSTTPNNYAEVCEAHARKGFRVIALAYRALQPEERTRAAISDMTRQDAECNLIFCGFAVFQCPLKKDALDTISNLQGGSHRCVIITGDSVDTAICVGREVGLLASKTQVSTHHTHANASSVQWMNLETKEMLTDLAALKAHTFVRTRKHQVPSETEWDLCVNAEGMTSEQFSNVVASVGHLVAVWARCAPSQKEDIAADLKRRGHVVLMAGDGTNDVGALKQAHTGIAVLNSAAISNAAPASPAAANGPAATTKAVTAPSNSGSDVPEGLFIPPGFQLTPIPPPVAPDAGFMVNMKYQVAVAKRKAEIMHLVKMDEARKKAKNAPAVQPAQKNEVDKSQQDPSEFLMQSLFNDDTESSHGPPIVKLGDASIAAPFTCKSKALMAVCDIVRMGRSTLVTTQQMYKILALNCLTQAYRMSVLHIDGVRLGDKQMMLSGVIMAICFICMSRCQPLDKLSPQRPIGRIFHPYMILSIFGQFALHLYCILASVNLVKGVDAATVLEQQGAPEDAEFKPTLLNSIIYLLTTLSAATTFAVNYRGEPFMQSIRSNRPMFYSLIILALVVFYLASEVDPEVNEMLEIVKFPSEEFRNSLLQILALDTIGAYLIEKVFLHTLTDA